MTCSSSVGVIVMPDANKPFNSHPSSPAVTRVTVINNNHGTQEATYQSSLSPADKNISDPVAVEFSSRQDQEKGEKIESQSTIRISVVDFEYHSSFDDIQATSDVVNTNTNNGTVTVSISDQGYINQQMEQEKETEVTEKNLSCCTVSHEDNNKSPEESSDTQKSVSSEELSPYETKSESSELDVLPPLTTKRVRYSLPSLSASNQQLLHQVAQTKYLNSHLRSISPNFSQPSSSIESVNRVYPEASPTRMGNVTPRTRRTRRSGVTLCASNFNTLKPDGPYYPQGNISRRSSSPSVSLSDMSRAAKGADTSDKLRGRQSFGGRRFSDIKALTASLGLHIHGSLLSLAGSYDKTFKVRGDNSCCC